MKLSVETKALRDKYGDKKAIEMIKDAGFECFDLSYYHLHTYDPLLNEDYLEYAKELRAYADSLGVSCCQAHAPFDLKYGEELNDENWNYLSIKRAIESAGIMGAKNIVVHALKTNEFPEVDFTEYNLNFYKSLEPYCAKAGVCIAIENLFYFDKKRKYFKGVLGSPDELCSFIEKLDSPWFTACVDVGHASLVGWEPEDFIRGMRKGVLQALHIQDNDYLGDRHILPYTGKLHWSSIMEALKAVEYSGEFNFEIQKFLSCFPDGLTADALKFEERVGRYLISLIEE